MYIHNLKKTYCKFFNIYKNKLIFSLSKKMSLVHKFCKRKKNNDNKTPSHKRRWEVNK